MEIQPCLSLTVDGILLLKVLHLNYLQLRRENLRIKLIVSCSIKNPIKTEARNMCYFSLLKTGSLSVH